MTPSNDLINGWLLIAEASQQPRFLTFATLAAEWGAKQERAACENLCESLANEDECDEMAYRALRQAAELIRKRGGGRREPRRHHPRG